MKAHGLRPAGEALVTWPAGCHLWAFNSSLLPNREVPQCCTR